MSKKTKDTTVDIDYADQAVPKEGRKGFLTMFIGKYVGWAADGSRT